ncbi:hypothetical protein INTERNEXUS_303 [Bacillus phage vB_BspM_Internexus]|nr:hypothetical protein INTERNEXUS_303 [Bacillus phage vB_BspM_Internexus]
MVRKERRNIDKEIIEYFGINYELEDVIKFFKRNKDVITNNELQTVIIKFGGDRILSNEEVGQIVNLSSARVNQLVWTAFEKCKNEEIQEGKRKKNLTYQIDKDLLDLRTFNLLRRNGLDNLSKLIDYMSKKRLKSIDKLGDLSEKMILTALETMGISDKIITEYKKTHGIEGFEYKLYGAFITFENSDNSILDYFAIPENEETENYIRNQFPDKNITSIQYSPVSVNGFRILLTKLT